MCRNCPNTSPNDKTGDGRAVSINAEPSAPSSQDRDVWLLLRPILNTRAPRIHFRLIAGGGTGPRGWEWERRTRATVRNQDDRDALASGPARSRRGAPGGPGRGRRSAPRLCSAGGHGRVRARVGTHVGSPGWLRGPPNYVSN